LPSSSTLPNLVGAAAKLEEAAVGWWTVAYTVPTKRTRRFEDGVDDDTGKQRYRYEIRDEVNLIVRGWRGAELFLAAWSAKRTDPGVAPAYVADCAYWWTREHEAWAELPRERVTWTTPQPTPVRVSFKELTRLVKTDGLARADEK